MYRVNRWLDAPYDQDRREYSGQGPPIGRAAAHAPQLPRLLSVIPEPTTIRTFAIEPVAQLFRNSTCSRLVRCLSIYLLLYSSPASSRFLSRSTVWEGTTMPNHNQPLFDYLAQQGITFADRDAVLKCGLGDEVVEALSDELTRRASLTAHQLTEIRAGRADPLVFGEYVVRDKIGEGAQAVVYKAKHRGMSRTDALKVFRAELVAELSESDRRHMLDRFQQGVRAAAGLRHENIVITYGFDRRANVVAMEYVDGPDLDGVLQLKEPSAEDAIGYVLQAARGIAFGHQQGVLHRDIKPRNLLFDERSGKVKVADWGLARIDARGTLTSCTAPPRLTISEEVFGTPHFIAPEQVDDAYTADQRADIYSLGCTLYTLLTRKPIYDFTTKTLTMLAHGDPTVPIPSLRGVRGASAQLDEVFHRMVAKRREHRFQTMGEVVAALQTSRTSLASVEAA